MMQNRLFLLTVSADACSYRGTVTWWDVSLNAESFSYFSLFGIGGNGGGRKCANEIQTEFPFLCDCSLHVSLGPHFATLFSLQTTRARRSSNTQFLHLEIVTKKEREREKEQSKNGDFFRYLGR